MWLGGRWSTLEIMACLSVEQGLFWLHFLRTISEIIHLWSRDSLSC